MARNGHIPIARYRADSGPALLSQGFRPFFLLSAIWAVAALVLSQEMIRGRVVLPTAFDPINWHYHELLFGYVAAVIAGFLLTAIPNWTGRLPLQGLPLLGLVVLWLAGRIAVGVSAWIGISAAAAIDMAFLIALASAALREIVAGKNWRNLVPVAGILFLVVANALAHGEAANLVDSEGASQRLALAVVVLLISLIGGRVVPSFTRNWLVKHGADRLPASFGTVDRIALAATFAALGLWTVAPEGPVVGAFLAVAALLQFLRLARWRGGTTFREPLLWVLHLGYLWIPCGLALLAANYLLPAVPANAAIHALTVGAMGTMTLAVMSRAVLGHTGRDLHAGPGLTAVYLLITAAAASRVLAALWDGLYNFLLVTAAGAWSAAFLCFLMVCGPMLVRRRKD